MKKLLNNPQLVLLILSACTLAFAGVLYRVFPQGRMVVLVYFLLNMLIFAGVYAYLRRHHLTNGR